ncbi:MAG: 5-oxoprolinase subunit PxpB [Kyrpidia sp.]|nr:5-oxoprolinase subunit PxpB [Kyrpidia sp.]
MNPVEIHPLGDSAAVVRFGSDVDPGIHARVMAFVSHLEADPIPGMVECVPAFTTVAVFYDPIQMTYAEVEECLRERISAVSVAVARPARVVEIPVCYGGEFGPDLEHVAAHNGLTAEEVIRIHTAPEYMVYAIGFSPGFPYLGGMSEKIATPRLPSPRLAVPAGTVGIAGRQTGVYPIETPGGWRLIGRTPVRLFRPEEYPPSLLVAGDKVRFRAIGLDEFKAIAEGSVTE